MVTWRATDDGVVTPAVREIYLRYALGGAGMIVLEAIGVREVASAPLLRLSHDRYVLGLRDLVGEMKAASPHTLVVPQIIDFLKIARRQATRPFVEGLVRRGQAPATLLERTDAEIEAEPLLHLGHPRLVRDLRFGYRQTIEDLSLPEIRALPDAFADAARRAQACGFDGVELHFAHAYTLASFLSVTNRRTDRYGGCFENRLRLPLEVIEAVRGAVGPGFLVGCRYLGSEDILGDDGLLQGNDLAEASRIGVALARAGLDFLSISRGGKFDDAKQPKVGEAAYPYTGHSGHVCIPRQKSDPPGVNTFLAEGIRAAVRAAGFDTPVVTAGKIVTREAAEAILREGRADLVGMARALLADPDLPRKWQAGRDADVRACVFCPFCEEEDERHRVVTCTLWPKGTSGPRHRLTPAVWRSGEAWDPHAAFDASRARESDIRHKVGA
jgi:2,4-dienoyl-CoA reductase-like NADH-dependent reductase (Old Yellow Enzyme family)